MDGSLATVAAQGSGRKRSAALPPVYHIPLRPPCPKTTHRRNTIPNRCHSHCPRPQPPSPTAATPISQALTHGKLPPLTAVMPSARKRKTTAAAGPVAEAATAAVVTTDAASQPKDNGKPLRGVPKSGRFWKTAPKRSVILTVAMAATAAVAYKRNVLAATKYNLLRLDSKLEGNAGTRAYAHMHTHIRTTALATSYPPSNTIFRARLTRMLSTVIAGIRRKSPSRPQTG